MSDANEKIEESFEEEEEQEDHAAESVMSKAEEIAERIEKANKEAKSILEQQRKLAVTQTLRGKARAGSKKISPEEKELQETKRWLKGTGFEDMLDMSQ